LLFPLLVLTLHAAVGRSRDTVVLAVTQRKVKPVIGLMIAGIG